MRTRHLILEGRQDRNNQRDRQRIIAAQSAGKASRDLTYEFGLPSSEPLLWLADAVAGAVLAAESGHDTSMIAIIQHSLRRVCQ